MAKFITRIELQYADSDDYEKLHAEMEKEGFEKTIIGDDGQKFHLPDGEYFYDKPIHVNAYEKDFDAVLNKAIKAANKTNKSFRAITSRTDALKWHNLRIKN